MMHYVTETVKWLDEHPDEWTVEYATLRHKPSGVAVWINNRPYGMHIEVRGYQVWGGVTALSAFGLSWRHWQLHFAMKRWERRAGNGLFERHQ